MYKAKFACSYPEFKCFTLIRTDHWRSLLLYLSPTVADNGQIKIQLPNV